MLLRHVIILFLSCSYVSTEQINLDEGSKCMWKGVSGMCVSIYRCLSSLIDHEEKDYAPICSFQGKDPIVCCTDCSLVNDTRTKILNHKLGILQKTGQKAHDKCIEYIHRLDYDCKKGSFFNLVRHYQPDANCNKITGVPFGFIASYADKATRGEFSHMALLGYGDTIANADWICGGSVISERFILTAAHCLSSSKSGAVKYAALGILKRTDPSELWQIYNVKRRIPHPEYKSPSKYHDIALLETDTEISFKNQVKPACLHVAGEEKDILTASGWGALGYKERLADNLQSVRLARFEEDPCSEIYPPHRHLKNGYNHTTQLCYGDKQVPKNTCEGDSGGPLQFKSYDGFECTFTILGVTSFGTQCGISAGSGIYTRVIYYVPWIESVVWP